MLAGLKAPIGRHGVLALALVSAPMITGQAYAQSVDEPPGLSFDAAVIRLKDRSQTLSRDDHELQSAKATEAATRTLHRPVITGSASFIEYQKTLPIDLSGSKSDVLGATSNLLNQLPSQFPGDYQAIISQVTQRVGAALPGLLSAIPDNLQLQEREGIFRPSITAAMPLYTGGAIGAVQRGARAAVGLAEAQKAGSANLVHVGLVQAYFGQEVATALTTSMRQTLDAFERHLADAQKLEANGMLPRAKVLEVQVAHDTARRAWERAQLQEETAKDMLGRLLDEPTGVTPTSPLFVRSAPLAPVQTFLDGGDTAPGVLRADAARRAAKAGVDLAHSRYLPQVFAYGSYNFNRDHAIPIDPDWIAGVTFQYTFWSNIDRGKGLEAARERELGAAAAAEQARKDVATEIVRAWNLVETARRSFLLLDSNLASAVENVRAQSLSFKEGEAPSSTLIDAEAALASVRTERIAAAYEYDLALAGLLAASNRLDEFSDLQRSADHQVEASR